MILQAGIDVLLSNHYQWKTQRIGLVTNNAAKTITGISSRQALIENNFNIVKLFSPEHGLAVTGADGTFIHDGYDALTGLPIISLYGKKLQPDAEDLQDIELFLFDIPDVGARFYTYLWTLSYILEAAAKWQIPIIITDRPNPISGKLDLAEGPILQHSCASFIGRWAMPIRHSCTLGELAQYFNSNLQINAPLTVIPIKNYDRNTYQTDWGLAFEPTSPAIQNFEAALCYAGTALLEATNISEGRGTPYSFFAAGAPWMQSEKIAMLMNKLFANILQMVPTQFTPSSSKYAGEICNGIELKIFNREKFHPVFMGLVLIKIVKDLHAQQFKWQHYVTHVNPDGSHHLDKLLGIPNSENLFEKNLDAFIDYINPILQIHEQWEETILPFLLY